MSGRSQATIVINGGEHSPAFNEGNLTMRLFAIENTDEGMVVRLQVPRPLPKATIEHLRGAQRELLLAARSLIDAAIEWTEKPARADQRPRRTEIKVE